MEGKMAGNRIGRINEEMLRELSELIRTVKDPRVSGLVSITRVETTNDLRYAKVFVSVLGNQGDGREVLKGLKSASGFLRREVAKAVQLRNTPELTFELDESISRGARIFDLLGKIERQEAKDDADR